MTQKAVYKTVPLPGPVLRKRAAMAFVCLGETQFDEKVAAGELPAPIAISDTGRTKVWLRAELEAWLLSRVAKRDAALAEQPPKEKRRKAVA